MKIGEKEYLKIIVTDKDGNLLVDMSDNAIIQLHDVIVTPIEKEEQQKMTVYTDNDGRIM